MLILLSLAEGPALAPAWAETARCRHGLIASADTQNPGDEMAVLVLPESAEGAEALRVAEAVHLARSRPGSVPSSNQPRIT